MIVLITIVSIGIALMFREEQKLTKKGKKILEMYALKFAFERDTTSFKELSFAMNGFIYGIDFGMPDNEKVTTVKMNVETLEISIL